MITFQEILRRLSHFWEEQGCIIHQGYDLEVGAGTFNPATFLRCFGPEPYRAAYIEPCRRPTDGRYGTNPNRLQHYFQYQVVLKPSPPNIQELYLQSLEAIGFNLKEHDIRFVHDDWEAPTLGAWGLGWEIWIDGMEVTQFTYFQSVGGITLKPITGEITYGLERLAMYIQKVDNVFDLKWNDELTYRDIYFNNEVEWSHYNFELASTDMWFKHFADYEQEAKRLMEQGFPLPAYDFCMKASHAFNLLDARGAISVTERTGYIARIRDLSKAIAESYLASREKLGYPLLHKFSKFSDAQVTSYTPPIRSIQEEFKSVDGTKSDDFLLEIGSEELPAVFVPIGLQNLEKSIKELLTKEAIPFESIKMMGTPRRLSCLITKLHHVKPAKMTEKKGPPVDQIYDIDGSLKAAGEGFFKSTGLEVTPLAAIRKGKEKNLQIKQIKGVDYLFAYIENPEVLTAEILSKELPHLILQLDFPKKMRWGSSDISFARPIRWIACLHGNHVIPFNVGSIFSGRHSFGHRQLNNYDFSLVKAQDYVKILKEHRVMVDIAERKEAIIHDLNELEVKLEAKIISRDKVIPQVLNLVEWPQLTYSSFDKNFLVIPKEVLISEMVEHQKYFPVANKDGSLKNFFIITADNTPSDFIRLGNERVLSARLSDGAFLYKQGLKMPLENYNEKLKSITFQAGLGSMYNKIERIIKHAELLQKKLKVQDLNTIKRAALLCKADLATEMVYEFPDLQGTIGKYYAENSNEGKDVALAIEEHWMPKGENAPLPSSITGTIISLADKIDNILACFCMDLKPTSSSDPYALRRQTLGIIKMLVNGKYRLPLMQTFKDCLEHFPVELQKNKEIVLKEIESFLTNRIKTVFLDYNFAKDEIEASIAMDSSDIYDIFCKAEALHHFRKKSDKFPLLYEVYKRAKGQLGSTEKSSFSQDLLLEKAEKSLHELLEQKKSQFAIAMQGHDYDKAYELIADIQPGVANLFNEVKILADDPSLRNNRIALLQQVFGMFSELLDLSKINEK